MCGRYTLSRPDKIKIEGVKSADTLGIESRYNIAPGQNVLGVIEQNDERHALFLHWGLIPSWSKEARGVINARAETLTEKPSFRDSFKRRRCLIPADTFYEWKTEGSRKQPFCFRMKNEDVFAFAGLWDTWRKDETSIASCAIITTTPNKLVSTVHDRMPVILHPSDYDMWLSGEVNPNILKELLVPFPAEYMESYPVTTDVNSPSIDEARLIKRLS